MVRLGESRARPLRRWASSRSGGRGRSWTSGPVQQRVVLAVLLLHANRAVSRDALIAAVWGESAPKSVVNLVHRHASGVRRALEPERTSRSAASLLTWTNSAYRLDIPPAALDVEAFETGLTRAKQQQLAGRPAEAAEALREALALWRGPLCDGLTSPFLDAERDRLAEQRLGRSRTASSSTSRWATTIRPRRRAAADWSPSTRRRNGCTASSCAPSTGTGARPTPWPPTAPPGATSGRSSDRPFRAAAGDPPAGAGGRPDAGSAGRSEAPARAVAARPAAGDATASGTPAQLPHALADFAGREAELAALDEVLAAERRGDRRRSSRRSPGTAGVGKTTLAVHWAHRVADRFPDGQLYVNLRGFDPRGCRDRAGRGAARLPRRARRAAPSGSRPTWRRRPRCTAACSPAGGCWSCSTTPATPSRSARCCPARPAAWCW